jgi:antitoxin component YwqK of YwqJK toxin-antitoxin module
MNTQESRNQIDVLKLLKQQQDLPHAIVGGAAAALVGASIWATITVLTNYQIGYMAILIGFLVGFSIRYFGSGIDQIFGILGGLLALVGCALGNLFSQVAFIAQSESMGYIEVISVLNLDLVINIYKESFSPMDIFFYGIAGYEGYKFAFRPITEELLAHAKNGTIIEVPYANFRLPIIIILFVLLSFGGYFLIKGNEIEKTRKYESGAVMSKGLLLKGRENGLWTYWWENGQKQAIGMYSNGKADSLWQYFDENGMLTKDGTFDKGFENGKWTNYYPNGKVSSVSNYRLGRLDGDFISYYDNGSVNQRGVYNADLLNGKIESFFPNKKLNFSGSYKNNQPIGPWTYWDKSGKVSEELLFEKGKVRILNAWDSLGNQIVKDGNGVYKTFNLNGSILEIGSVKETYRFGVWRKYFENEKLNEEGEYRNGEYFIINIWDENGQLMIEKGKGKFSYVGEALYETGNIENGQRSGEWISKISESDSIPLQLINYKNGKLEGSHKSFFESGELNIEGTFKDNERDGEWVWHYKTGMIETAVKFENGSKEGVQIFYDEDGNKTKTEIYKNNRLIDIQTN